MKKWRNRVMGDNKNNNENKHQRTDEKPYLEHGNYEKRGVPNDRITKTGQKPSPGHKK